jgi:multiple sugar transport system permease protein
MGRKSIVYKRLLFSKFVLLVGAYLIALAILLPIIWLVISSLRPAPDILGAPYRIPSRLTVQNYLDLWHIPGFVQSMRNSLLVAIMTTIITAVLSLPIGYLLSRYRFKGRRSLQIFALSGYLFAPAVLALPYFELLSQVSLVDSLWGIAFTHIAFCLPFSLALSGLIFRSVPITIEEVAMLDGSGLLRRLFFIIVPAARYQVIALLLLVFTISWKEFFFAFLVSSGYRTWTLPVLLGTMYGGDTVNWPLLCALSTILVIPSLLILFWGRIEKVVPLLGAGHRG